MTTDLINRLETLTIVLQQLRDRLTSVLAAQQILKQQGSILADLKAAMVEARSATLQ